MNGYVYLIKMFVSNDQDIYKFGRTKRKFMDRFNEYPKEAQPKIELVLWHDNIQTFETEVLREFRKVFRERRDIGYEYFQGDVEQMKQLIISHYIPAILISDVKDMMHLHVEKHNSVETQMKVLVDKQNVLERQIKFSSQNCDDKWELALDRLEEGFKNVGEISYQDVKTNLEELEETCEDVKTKLEKLEETCEDMKVKLEDIEDNTVNYDELDEMYSKVTKYIDKMHIRHFQEHVEDKISLYQEFINAICKQHTDTIITHKMYDYITFVIKELYDFFNYIHDECRREKTVCYSPSYLHDNINYDEDEWSVSVEEISDILERLHTLKELWRMKIDVVRTTFRDFVQINNMISNIGYFVNRSWRGHCEKKLDISNFFSFKVMPLEDVPKCFDSIVETIQNMTRPYHEPIPLEETILINRGKELHVTLNTEITPENLVQEAIAFHKQQNLINTDLIETIQEMLNSKIYILSEDFTKSKVESQLESKLDFDEANTYFLSAIAPKAIKKDALHKLLFKSVTCEDLI